MRLLYCFLFFYTQIRPATEYCYPVASLGNGSTVLYIHQHSPTNIELLEWNTQTNQTEQMLWSVFNPAGLQLLPNNAGFSFIDNGRLRIKSFEKRSPKAIDFDEPLFGINGLQWINEQTCYCSAYYNDNFALFELHVDGTLEILAWHKGSDYLYPQKIDDQLFYIERCTTNNGASYHIMQCTYHHSDATSVTNFGNTPIIFLTMLSATQGFVLEHAQKIDSESSTTPFSYHQIIKKGDVWCKNLLFSFSVPTNLLLEGEQRLYESILPLLPRVNKNKIYFVDCAKNIDFTLEPYSYDYLTKITKKIVVPTKKGHYFVPMLCGNRFYCGGTKFHSNKAPLISLLT